MSESRPLRRTPSRSHPGHAPASRYDKAMSGSESLDLGHLPVMPRRRDVGIGVVGAGFIVRDCHLVAYADAGYRVVGITSRSIEKAREVAALRGLERIYGSLEDMLDDPAIEVVDIAVPPKEQSGVV